MVEVLIHSSEVRVCIAPCVACSTVEVRLHTHTVDESLSLERFEDSIDDTVLLVVSELVIVVVEELTALGSVLSCIGESLFNEAVAAVNLSPL